MDQPGGRAPARRRSRTALHVRRRRRGAGRARELFARKVLGTTSATEATGVLVSTGGARLVLDVSAVPLKTANASSESSGSCPAPRRGAQHAPRAPHTPASRGASPARARTLDQADRPGAPPEHRDGQAGSPPKNHALWGLTHQIGSGGSPTGHLRPRSSEDDAIVSRVFVAAQTHCRGRERNYSRKQRWQAAARVSAVRRDALEQLALRIERLIAELAEARVELSAVARAGRSEGASIRAIAEADGLSRPRVYELLHDASKSREAGESMDVNPTCG